MTDMLQALSIAHSIDAQYARRAESGHIGLKINLYDGIDVHGLSLAVASLDPNLVVESVMVGDSYFMTRLGRASTRLTTPSERAWGLDSMVDLVHDVAGALHGHFVASRPYLVADLPDGSTDDDQSAIAATERLIAAGADVVKIEVDGTSRRLDRIATLVDRSYVVMAHIGYTPQSGPLRRFGDTIEEAHSVFALARRVRDAGVSVLVVEMVGESVNQALSRPASTGIPVYSIFSGRCSPGGGQCVNVWDCVYRHPSGRRSFPPTARYQFVAARPRALARDGCVLRASAAQLVAQQQFPPSPLSHLTADDAAGIAAENPWASMARAAKAHR